MMADSNVRIDILEAGLQSLTTSIEVIKTGQKFAEIQQTSLMGKLEQLSHSLQDPNQSALGRALSQQINGCASRFDNLLAEQDKEIASLRKLVHDLHDQSQQVKGALGLLKFVGFSALLSSVIAIILIFLQLMRVIVP